MVGSGVRVSRASREAPTLGVGARRSSPHDFSESPRVARPAIAAGKEEPPGTVVTPRASSGSGGIFRRLCRLALHSKSQQSPCSIPSVRFRCARSTTATLPGPAPKEQQGAELGCRDGENLENLVGHLAEVGMYMVAAPSNVPGPPPLFAIVNVRACAARVAASPRGRGAIRPARPS